MPKQTFHNLSIEKKQTLLVAAKKEFSRVPLHEAVISNIIKSADISRGSFYQYFEDLEDLFFYILGEHVKKNKNRFASELQLQKGDLLETFISLFGHMLEDFKSEENRVFFHNAFLNMNHKVGNAFTEHTNMKNFTKQKSDFLQLIDSSKLNISSEQELIHIMKILKAVTFQNLTQSFAMKLSTEKALEIYTLEINMLKKGLYLPEDSK